MSKNFSTISIYDTLPTSFTCCCSYDNEKILLGNNSGFFLYNIITKTITQIYSESLFLKSMAYYEGNIYYVSASRYADGNATMNKLNIITLDKTSIQISDNSSMEQYSYEDGTIKLVEDGIIFLCSRTYNGKNLDLDAELSYTQFIAIKIPFDLSSSSILFLSTSDHSYVGITYYRYPISSILKKWGNGYKIFWYSYAYRRVSETRNYSKQGYTSNMTPVLSIDTFDEEIGIFNAFEDSDNYYILTKKYLIELNKETDVTRILIDNPTSLAPLHYAFVGNSVYGIVGYRLVKIPFTEYSNTYSIKSSNGSQTFASIDNAPPITKFIFRYSGDNVVAELTTPLDVIYLNYTPENVSGKYLVGFSTSPNAKIQEYDINKTYDIYIADSLTFYEVYETYRPPVTTLDINLYKNSAEPHRVDKTNYLEQVGLLKGAFRSETSIINPIITIQQVEIPQFNYVYIPIFNRYYYVVSITSIRYGLWEISLSIDVLMSFKNDLLNCVGFIDRNEKYFAPYSIDNERVIRQGTVLEDVAPLTITPGYPNILLRDIVDETAGRLSFQTEFCIVMNGYNLKAKGYTE